MENLSHTASPQKIENGGISNENNSRSSCCGRLWSDWSQIPLTIGIATSSAAFLVGFTINDYYLSGGAALFFITQTIACGRITCLGPKRKTAVVVKQANKAVDHFSEGVLQIQVQSDRLVTAQQTLNDQLSLSLEFQENRKVEIEGINSEFQEFQKEWENLKKIHEKFKMYSEEMELKVLEFQQEFSVQSSINDIGKSIRNLGIENKILLQKLLSCIEKIEMWDKEIQEYESSGSSMIVIYMNYIQFYKNMILYAAYSQLLREEKQKIEQQNSELKNLTKDLQLQVENQSVAMEQYRNDFDRQLKELTREREKVQKLVLQNKHLTQLVSSVKDLNQTLSSVFQDDSSQK